MKNSAYSPSYIRPEITVVEVNIEQGFAASTPDSIFDAPDDMVREEW